MADFSWAIALAKKLITENGEESILVRTLGGTPPDAAKPWITGTPDVTEYPVFSVWIKNSTLRRPSLAKDSESFVILAASDLPTRPDPSTDHLRRADGRRYTVLQSDPLDPAGDDIIFELKVSA